MTLEKALERFPAFLISTLLGLVKAALTEPEVFLLLALGAVIGILTSPLWGVAVALAFYLVLRMVSQVAALFAQKADRLVEVIGKERASLWTPADGVRGPVQPEGHSGVREGVHPD